MKTKPLSPAQVAEEVEKLIKVNTKNVELVINGINEAMITQKANFPNGMLKTGIIVIHVDDIRRPNKNWHQQSVETMNNALKAFQKDWKVKRIGKWHQLHCTVEFTPKK